MRHVALPTLSDCAAMWCAGHKGPVPGTSTPVSNAKERSIKWVVCPRLASTLKGPKNSQRMWRQALAHTYLGNLTFETAQADVTPTLKKSPWTALEDRASRPGGGLGGLLQLLAAV